MPQNVGGWRGGQPKPVVKPPPPPPPRGAARVLPRATMTDCIDWVGSKPARLPQKPRVLASRGAFDVLRDPRIHTLTEDEIMTQVMTGECPLGVRTACRRYNRSQERHRD